MATMKVGAAPSDWEDEALQSQIATAQALRNKGLNDPSGQMIGDWYMAKSPWAILGQTAGGGLLEQAARGRQGEIQQGREQEVADWLRQRPSAMTEQTKELAGPMPEGGPEILTGTVQVPKPFQQQASEMQDWSSKGAQIRHPLAQSMASAGLQHALTMPEKQLAAETAAQEKVTALGLTLDAKREAAREKMEEQRLRDEREHKRDIELRRLAASLRPPKDPQQPKTVETDQGVLQWNGKEWSPIKVGDKTAMPKATGAAKQSAQEKKSMTAVDTLLDKITAAEQGLPYASGAGAVVPAGIRQHYTDENVKIADASISSLGAEQAHELYGAAFTTAEQARAAQFLPVTTGLTPDTTATLTAKVKALKMLAEKKRARLLGEPDPYPKMYNEVLDPVTKPIGAAPAAAAPAAAPNSQDAAALQWANANPNDSRAVKIKARLGVQ